VKKDQTQREAAGAFRRAGPYLNIVYTFFGAIIFFGYIGYVLDEKFLLRPYLLIAGVFLGFGLGLYRMIMVVNQIESTKKKS